MMFKAYNSFLIWPPNDKIDDRIFWKVVKSTSRWQIKNLGKKKKPTNTQTNKPDRTGISKNQTNGVRNKYNI